jgi:diguanylate cyclase (GGDEF)-like protein
VPAFTILDARARLDFERRFLLLRLAFLLTAGVLLVTYGWNALGPSLSVVAAVALDCGFVWLLLRYFPAFVLRTQLGLRLLDILVAYVVLLQVHAFLGNAYYDSVYIFFVVGATATHGQRGMMLTAAAGTLAVFLGRMQLILMGSLSFAPRHITDIFFYGLLFGATGVTTGFLMTKSNEKHHYLALHDPLTGLPNRTLFQDRLRQGLLAAARDSAALGLLIMDLDRFKEVNDTFGHYYGDLLLREMAVRLRARLRESDTVARLGGDEFAVVLPATGAEGAQQVARAIQEAFDEPVVLEDRAFDLTVSVGIAIYPDHGEDATLLLRHADVAMYQAKQYDAGFALYDPGKDHYSTERTSLIADLRRAIEKDELALHFQPKVRLRTGEIEGVEALLRWEHGDQGMVPPDVFVPLAERAGLIRPLTRWVLEQAIAQAGRWQEMGLCVPVAVNLSARSLHDPDIECTITSLIRRWGIEPSLLELELTESAVMADPGRAQGVLTRLHDLGIRIAIDDFGTGYSSLGYLKRLPVDVIKIDRSFVMDMGKDVSVYQIVKATVGLGRDLGLTTVAEGVENQGDWNRLAMLGCDLAQGHHLAPPLPPDAVTAWLADRMQAASPKIPERESAPRLS